MKKSILRIIAVLALLAVAIPSASACWFEDPDPNENEIIFTGYQKFTNDDGCTSWAQLRSTRQTLVETDSLGGTTTTVITSYWQRNLPGICNGMHFAGGAWKFLYSITKVTIKHPSIEMTNPETGGTTTVTTSESNITDAEGNVTGSTTQTETVSTDPETGDTTTTTETTTKDAEGNVTEAVTKTAVKDDEG
ncbi:MAG: hypothetical protein GX945_02345, partial [Lentisphaerae bacterium]|nr:hypothetical protein [Lentisphaerota bacterium]